MTVPAASWKTSLTATPRAARSARAASMSERASTRLPPDPGTAAVTPVPKMIDACDPVVVSDARVAVLTPSERQVERLRPVGVGHGQDRDLELVVDRPGLPVLD